MVVGNNRFDAFDGVAYDRHSRQFRQLDRFKVLGRPNELRFIGEPSDLPADGALDRQQRIPGWNQPELERQRIGVIGAGGIRAPLLQTLVSIGAGTCATCSTCCTPIWASFSASPARSQGAMVVTAPRLVCPGFRGGFRLGTAAMLVNGDDPAATRPMSRTLPTCSVRSASDLPNAAIAPGALMPGRTL